MKFIINSKDLVSSIEPQPQRPTKLLWSKYPPWFWCVASDPLWSCRWGHIWVIWIKFPKSSYGKFEVTENILFTLNLLVYFLLKWGFLKKSFIMNAPLVSCPFPVITFGWVCCCKKLKVIQEIHILALCVQIKLCRNS